MSQDAKVLNFGGVFFTKPIARKPSKLPILEKKEREKVFGFSGEKKPDFSVRFPV